MRDGWYAPATEAAVIEAIAQLAESYDLEPAPDPDPFCKCVSFFVAPVSGGVLVMASDEVCSDWPWDLAARLSTDAVYASTWVVSEQTSTRPDRAAYVAAGRTTIRSDGSHSSEDLSDMATDLCWDALEEGALKAIEDYYLDQVLAECLDLEAEAVEEAASTELRFRLSAHAPKSARVRGLVSRIRGGATWALAEIGGQQAVRVQGENGTSISVLSSEEMEMFRAAIKA